ncbi:MAG: NUMOD1 domain-containing DNA-binding protein [Nanoarchaeota archaeon]
MQYYLYRHIRLDKNEPFYIGIGSKSNNYNLYCQEFMRAFNRSARNKIWKGIVSRTEYDVEIMLEFDNYEDAKKKEIEFIALYGKIKDGTGTLCNLTNGGEGVLGLSPANKGKKVSEKERLRLLSYSINRKVSDKTRQLMSEKAKLGKNVKTFYLASLEKSRKKVYQYSLDKMLLNTFISAADAGRNLGLSRNTISDSILHNRKTKGFIWSYNKLENVN